MKRTKLEEIPNGTLSPEVREHFDDGSYRTAAPGQPWVYYTPKGVVISAAHSHARRMRQASLAAGKAEAARRAEVWAPLTAAAKAKRISK